MRILLTGGTGFFGGVLKAHLHAAGHDYVNLDRLADPADETAGRMAVTDLRNAAEVETVFAKFGPFDAVIHAAADLAHDVKDCQALWDSNVEGTRHIAEACRRHGTQKLVFISSNCLWGKPLNRPVVEDDPPAPVELYGRSKLAAEQLLRDYRETLDVIIFRSSTIIAPGRVGLLGILFDFIAENRRIPVVGRKDRPYQFIDADEYAAAILLALSHPGSDIFHVGSPAPVSLEKSYAYVIRAAGSSSKLYHLPEFPTLALMRLCYLLKLSPLGPYHYGMIAEEFVFDTRHVERTLGWKATKTNGEILYGAYDYYVKHKAELEAAAASLPAHRRKSHSGIITLLKWIS